MVVEGEDLLGDGVNIAARLEQLCTPGGVMVSGTAYDHLKGKLNVPFDFAGQKRVKNISQPVRTYTLRMAGVQRSWSWRTRLVRRWHLAATLAAVLLVMGLGLWWWSQRVESTIDKPTVAESPIGKPSIAVLPFDNLGGDDATGRLAAGVTEDIITDLSRYRDLDVMARNATAAYAGKPVDIRAVGKALNVRYVLEGSIQQTRRAGPRDGAVDRGRSRHAPVVRTVGQACHGRLRGAGRGRRAGGDPAGGLRRGDPGGRTGGQPARATGGPEGLRPLPVGPGSDGAASPRRASRRPSAGSSRRSTRIRNSPAPGWRWPPRTI